MAIGEISDPASIFQQSLSRNDQAVSSLLARAKSRSSSFHFNKPRQSNSSDRRSPEKQPILRGAEAQRILAESLKVFREGVNSLNDPILAPQNHSSFNKKNSCSHETSQLSTNNYDSGTGTTTTYQKSLSDNERKSPEWKPSLVMNRPDDESASPNPCQYPSSSSHTSAPVKQRQQKPNLTPLDSKISEWKPSDVMNRADDESSSPERPFATGDSLYPSKENTKSHNPIKIVQSKKVQTTNGPFNSQRVDSENSSKISKDIHDIGTDALKSRSMSSQVGFNTLSFVFFSFTHFILFYLVCFCFATIC